MVQGPRHRSGVLGQHCEQDPPAAETNRAIGGAAPSSYLARVEVRAQLEASDVDDLLDSHGVSPEAMRTDDFHAHFTHRKTYLLDLIESAMGKRVQREDEQVDAAAIAAEYEPEDEVEVALEGAP